MRNLLCLALLCLWAVLPATAQTAPPKPDAPAPREWRTYVQPAGGFAVTSPVPLDTKIAIPFQTAKGKATMHQFLGLRGGDAYFACFMEMNFSELPEEVRREVASRLFENFVRDVARTIDGQVLEDTPVTIQGNPGRRFQIQLAVKGEKMTSHGRVTLIGQRFYFLQVVAPEREDAPQTVAGSPVVRRVRFQKETADKAAEERTRFLESFRLMTAEEKEKFGTTRFDTLVPADGPEEAIDPSKVKPLPPPDQTPSSVTPSGPIRRAEGVLRGNAINRVTPEYPQEATAARIQGDVVCEILIDQEGKVVEAKILGGPPELHAAALAAVRQWTFKPTLLNGKPVRVIGEITFRFNLAK
jgi:TonB family protein